MCGWVDTHAGVPSCLGALVLHLVARCFRCLPPPSAADRCPTPCPLPARSARSARSDGTTTMVCLIGELMKHAERYIADGLHPRIIAEVQAGRKCGREGGREEGCVCVCSEGGGGWA